MKKYIEEAKEKARDIKHTDIKYAVFNGVVRRKYIEGKLILVFHALYYSEYKSVAYYNCCTHRFCNIYGK